MIKDTFRTALPIIVLFFTFNISFCQVSIFNPLLDKSREGEVKLVKKFQDLQNKLDEHSAKDSLNFHLQNLETFPSSFRSQIFIELISIHLNTESDSWKSEINNYIETSLWRKDVLINMINLSNIEVKYPEKYDQILNYIHENFNQIYYNRIEELKSTNIIDELIWVNSIWQRDQDFRKYFMYNNLRDTASLKVLQYFDQENLKSISKFINDFGYPNFTMGTYNLNFALLHFNNPDLLNLEEFNKINISIWESVVLGYTSLKDYCYIIDRYLVTNQKTAPLFGLYYPNDVTKEIIDSCTRNRLSIGLKL